MRQIIHPTVDQIKAVIALLPNPNGDISGYWHASYLQGTVQKFSFCIIPEIQTKGPFSEEEIYCMALLGQVRDLELEVFDYISEQFDLDVIRGARQLAKTFALKYK